MKKLRLITRVLVINEDKILLARNRGAKWWYPPGGGWEFNEETIKDCVSREVLEETGYSVVPEDVIWVQEFREEGSDKVYFETFWRARIADDNTQTEEGLLNHVDHDSEGMVEEARWFTQAEMNEVKVLPKVINSISDIRDKSHNAFIDNDIVL